MEGGAPRAGRATVSTPSSAARIAAAPRACTAICYARRVRAASARQAAFEQRSWRPEACRKGSIAHSACLWLAATTPASGLRPVAQPLRLAALSAPKRVAVGRAARMSGDNCLGVLTRQISTTAAPAPCEGATPSVCHSQAVSDRNDAHKTHTHTHTHAGRASGVH